jgi:GcrA cell cycle regulator
MPALQPTSRPTSQPTWTDERLELLKSCFAAGLSCREIANEIGVSRNAVIGKISRLNLRRETAAPDVPRKGVRDQGRRSSLRQRHQIFRAVMIEEVAVAEEPIHNGHSCSLFELNKETCRWPISTPGAADFCFCGNPPVEGLPYCAGHSRLAYRISAR